MFPAYSRFWKEEERKKHAVIDEGVLNSTFAQVCEGKKKTKSVRRTRRGLSTSWAHLR
jgi:hypothetical protein